MTKETKQRFATFIVALILYLPNLGLVPFWEWDEPAYAGASREMLASKDFVLPQLNNQIFLLKPPLLYWCHSISFYFFGENEFTARLPSAISAVLTSLICCEIALTCFGGYSGILAGIVSASSLMSLVFGRSSFLDSLFTLTLVIAFYAYIKSSNHKCWLYVTSIFIGLSILSRGLFGIIFPLVVVLSYSFLTKKIDWIKSRYNWLVFFIAIIIGASWYLAVELRVSKSFILSFFLDENLNRLVSSTKIGSASAFYYLKSIIIGCAPWSLFIVPVFYSNYCNVKSKTTNNSQLILFLSVCAPVLTLSLAATKWPHYVLAIFPFISILIAKEIEEIFLNSKSRIYLAYGILNLLIIGIFINTSWFSAGWFYKEPALEHHIWAGKQFALMFLVFGLMGSLLFVSFANKRFCSLIIMMITAIGISMLHAHTFLKEATAIDPLRNKVNLFSNNYSDLQYAVYRHTDMGISYYLKKHFEVIQEEEGLKDFFKKRGLVLMKLDDWLQLKVKYNYLNLKEHAHYYSPIEKINFVTLFRDL